jgi:uncharacterized protein YkwD
LLACAWCIAPAAEAAKPSRLPPVTRAEAASTLLHARMETIPLLMRREPIPDVPRDAWYTNAIYAASYYGILTPDANGFMRPDEPVTRSQFLKMSALTFGLPEALSHSYFDVPAGAWFSPYAGIAERYQLFPNDPDPKLLRPMKTVARDEAAAIVSFFAGQRERGGTQAERDMAAEQSGQQVQLYLTMSTRRQKVKLVWPQEQATRRVVAPKGPPSLHEVRREIVALVNAARTRNGLAPLRISTLLEESAQTYAREMAVGGFFSHVSPSGQTLKQRLEAVGYYHLREDPGCLCVHGIAVGENLARGQVTAAEVVADWLKSASHRKTILTPEYTDVGVGVEAGYWVQHFGGILREAE